jgi:hypothetical protein
VTGDGDVLEELIGKLIVVDMHSQYVCLGKLVRFDDNYFEMRDVDLHDLRDTETTRENYIAESVATGIKRNRRKLFLKRSEIVAISALEDFVDE